MHHLYQRQRCSLINSMHDNISVNTDHQGLELTLMFVLLFN